jgi:hypothetical protein
VYSRAVAHVWRTDPRLRLQAVDAAPVVHSFVLGERLRRQAHLRAVEKNRDRDNVR